MFENWQKLVSTRRLFILFLRITLLHEIKQNEKHPYVLLVVFGCMMFHHSLLGRTFICQSDHKPLKDMHQKYLTDVSPRVQRLLFKVPTV